MSKAHIMVDLETLGLRPDAVIVSIGAVHFDAENILDEFYVNVDWHSCMEVDLTIDQSTMNWWNDPAQAEARKAWDRPDAPKLPTALKQLQEWMWQWGGKRSVAFWGNGVDFDGVVLKSAYHALDADEPWNFYNQFCHRTMKSMFAPTGADVPRSGAHNALEDAKYQVRVLQRILKTHHLLLP